MDSFNLHQLEIFVAVVDNGSFTEAANQLYLAQSSVSSNVRALEDSLGIRLFRRESKRNLTLTPEGKRVYLHAQDILARCNALRSDAAGNPMRELSIGASTVPAQSLLPEYLAAFSAARPDCCCTLRCFDSSKVQQLLLDGEIQLGFVGSADNRKNLMYEPIAEDRLVMITPNTSRFAALKAQGVLGRELLGEPVIFREQGSGTQKLIDNYLSEIRLDPHIIHTVAYVSDPSVLQKMVIGGVGVSIMSALAVRECAANGQLLQFELDKQPVRRSLYMAWRKKGPMTALARTFADLVREQVRRSEAASGDLDPQYFRRQDSSFIE